MNVFVRPYITEDYLPRIGANVRECIKDVAKSTMLETTLKGMQLPRRSVREMLSRDQRWWIFAPVNSPVLGVYCIWYPADSIPDPARETAHRKISDIQQTIGSHFIDSVVDLRRKLNFGGPGRWVQTIAWSVDAPKLKTVKGEASEDSSTENGSFDLCRNHF